MAHLHSVYDTDKHFIIDPVTREIDNKSGKIKLMLGDHNSERFTFEIPRTVDGHDMTLCDRVEVHYINIDSSTRQTSKDVYQAVDVQKSPESDDVVIFSWLLSGSATKYFGTLNFRVTFKCLAADGAIDYAWSTDIYKGISVSDGINNTEAIAAEYSDILEQWKIELEGIAGSGGNPYPKCLYDPISKKIVWNTTKKRYIHCLLDEGATEYVYIATNEALPESSKGIIDSAALAILDLECLKGNAISAGNDYSLVSGVGTLSGAAFSGSPYGDFLTYKDREEIQGIINEVWQSVGDLDSLQTDAKNSLVSAVNELASNFKDGTVVSENADFAEVGEWSDGNPDAEDRTGYFVSVDTSEPGKTMVKATSNSDVRGVTIANPAFSANASADKYDDETGKLSPQYNYVCFAGFAPVIDNGTCAVNGRCMPADDGTAVPSINNMGYQIIERIDDTHVLILVEPQADMMVRIKEDVSNISDKTSINSGFVELLQTILYAGVYTSDQKENIERLSSFITDNPVIGDLEIGVFGTSTFGNAVFK